MKFVILFLVSVLVFGFTSPSLSTSILTVDDDVVLDYDGNPLEKDASYFIVLPGSRALGGRVALGPALETAETCSADVFLVRVLAIRGTPFTFTPVNSSEDVIKLGSALAIQSPTENPCGDSYSTVWKVTSSIITNGGISNTGPSCFRITRSTIITPQPAYTFEYCPYLCGGAKICWPVGTEPIKGGSFEENLSINGVNPFSFYFFKNPGSAAN
ncbi:Kunitz trypsin inhibitor 2-like protein [Tanacetum coccineum]